MSLIFVVFLRLLTRYILFAPPPPHRRWLVSFLELRQQAASDRVKPVAVRSKLSTSTALDITVDAA